jgi:site-specific DNA-adenine methylase
MSSLNYSIILIFGILAYVIITDPNVGEYLILFFKVIKMNFERYIWMVRLHPKNPITNLMMRQKYARIAEELQKEFSEKNE